MSTQDPTVNAESTLPRLLALSRQASAQGNPGLAVKLLDRAKQSAVLLRNASAQHCVAYQEACQQLLQPEGESGAVTKLLSLVESARHAAKGNQQAEDMKTGVLACVQLASWAQGQDNNATLLRELWRTDVGEYAELWQACGRRDQAQLQLLLTATRFNSEMALPWAALSNWLHSKVQEDGFLKVCSLCEAGRARNLAWY